MNSRLNYGYAVFRSAIARAIVDLVTHENISPNEKLSKTERHNLAHVLHNTCIMDGNVAPKTVVVRVLRLTEKQYEIIYMLTGELDYQEKIISKNCHILL